MLFSPLGTAEEKEKSTQKYQVDKLDATITLCAEGQGHVPLPHARFGYLLIGTSDLNENCLMKQHINLQFTKTKYSTDDLNNTWMEVTTIEVAIQIESYLKI